MNETETTPTRKPVAAQSPQPTRTSSTIFGVSVRAWLSILIVGTVCALASFGRDIPQVLGNLAISAISFYFGSTSSKKQQQQ